MVAQHRTEVAQRGGAVWSQPLLGVWRVRGRQDVVEGESEGPEGGDGGVREGTDVPVLGNAIR